MDIKNNKSFFSIAAVLILFLVLIVGINAKSDKNNTEANNFSGDDGVRSLADFTDLRNLVGFTENVTVIKVLDRRDRESIDGIFPLTLYKVEVLYNIKGGLEGVIDLALEDRIDLLQNLGMR